MAVAALVIAGVAAAATTASAVNGIVNAPGGGGGQAQPQLTAQEEKFFEQQTLNAEQAATNVALAQDAQANAENSLAFYVKAVSWALGLYVLWKLGKRYKLI